MFVFSPTGQCNDAYSAVQIAVALAKAFETDVNHLPLSFAVSWFEQKVIIMQVCLCVMCLVPGVCACLVYSITGVKWV